MAIGTGGSNTLQNWLDEQPENTFDFRITRISDGVEVRLVRKGVQCFRVIAGQTVPMRLEKALQQLETCRKSTEFTVEEKPVKVGIGTTGLIYEFLD